MRTQPMAGIESLMWDLEDDPRIRSGVAAVLVLDSPLSIAILRDRFAEVVAANPRLRSTVVRRPRPLSPNRWRVQDDLDMSDQITETTVTDRPDGLHGLVAEMMEAPYTTDRPLWNAALVHDVADGGAAIVIRMHHCITDGLGAMVMAAQFFDGDAFGTRLGLPPVEGVVPERKPAGWIPARVRVIAESMVEDAGTFAATTGAASRGAAVGAASAARNPSLSLQQAVAFAASTVRLLVPSPQQLSPVLQEHSGRTRIATIDLPLNDLKMAGKAMGATVNDVFLTGVSRGLYSYHSIVGSGTVPEIRLNMAVNSRKAADNGAGGNYFVPVRIRLPLTAGDMQSSVGNVQEVAKRGKEEPALGIAPFVSEILGRLPARVGLNATKGMYDGVDAAASNFPGPPIPLWIAGSRVTHFYAVGPRSGGAFGSTVISYNGTAHLSLNLDAGAVTHPEVLIDCLRNAFDEILAPAAVPDGENDTRADASRLAV